MNGNSTSMRCETVQTNKTLGAAVISVDPDSELENPENWTLSEEVFV